MDTSPSRPAFQTFTLEWVTAGTGAPFPIYEDNHERHLELERAAVADPWRDFARLAKVDELNTWRAWWRPLDTAEGHAAGIRRDGIPLHWWRIVGHVTVDRWTTATEPDDGRSLPGWRVNVFGFGHPLSGPMNHARPGNRNPFYAGSAVIRVSTAPNAPAAVSALWHVIRGALVSV